MTPPQVLSLNIGRGVPQPYTSAAVTGIDKRSVEQVQVREPGEKRTGLGSGMVGDTVGDQRHHGGTTQAVYAYAREDLDWWEQELGRPLANGIFGENLTTSGIDTATPLIGETWHFDQVVLRVEAPRIPCRTFAGHLGEGGWVKRFTAAERTGAYLSVHTPGVIRAGETITVHKPAHQVSILQLFRASMGDRDEARAVLEADLLAPAVRDSLLRKLGTAGR